MREVFYLFSFLAVVVIHGLPQVGYAVPLWLIVVVYLIIIRGLLDVFQKTQAVKSNFPLIGHFRYMLEAIRPEIQQYFIENNTDGRPIDRNDRSVVYQRSKKEQQVLPFGTQEDLYEEGQEWVCHSMFPSPPDKDFDRVMVGGSQCSQKYDASILNISAMSYGSLSHAAVEALNRGAKLGGFYHNTGEGGIAPYHKKGGDLVWQIGTGYFGCRNLDGSFNRDKFAEKATDQQVKMIELKLSQGAKPGKGGMLPGTKVTAEIAEIRGVPKGKDVLSPAGHSAFSGVRGLLEFVAELRELSGGKPVGFKICVGKPSEFLQLAEEMESCGLLPDFITVDGAEGGTGAAPIEFSNAVGMPLKDGLSLVSQKLKAGGLDKEIRVVASGKSLTGFHMIRNFALGADIINSGRGMMLALGCIQALRCHSNHCPVGITTNNPNLIKGLDVPTKAQRVASYHEETIKVVRNMLEAMGKGHPSQIEMADIYRRQSDGTLKTYAQTYKVT